MNDETICRKTIVIDLTEQEEAEFLLGKVALIRRLVRGSIRMRDLRKYRRMRDLRVDSKGEILGG